jgi:putative ABC transport system ATP-binding protein
MEAIVQIKNVNKSYQLGQTTVHALKNVTLDVLRGEFTALVGTSGSGKSTLLNMIGCIDDPDSGSIRFDGVDVTSLDDDAKSRLRNHKIGFIFQAFNLIPVLTVYENIELPLIINDKIPTKERKDRITQAMKDVGLESYLGHLPDQLSGGQRQRVAIARALAGSPDLVLADEPTANLDSTNSHKIIDLMLELNERRKVTFLFSTHDEKLMSRVSRIVHIQDGVIRS